MTPLQEKVNQHQRELENDLLEIFCLIEENTMQATVKALASYCRLFNIKDKIKANNLMQESYKKFNNSKK